MLKILFVAFIETTFLFGAYDLGRYHGDRQREIRDCINYIGTSDLVECDRLKPSFNLGSIPTPSHE